MEALQLAEIKEIELQILKHFDAFCRENKIKYYLSNGTLLGAIKYKGFIPWDDDIDILVPRDDYDKFLKIYQDTSQYLLIHSKKYSEYPFTFAKLCDTSTEIENGYLLEKRKIGIHIDIFPLDYWPQSKKKSMILAYKRKILLTMLGFSISTFYPGRTGWRTCIKYILVIISKIFGKQTLKKMLELNSIDKSEKASKKYRGCVEWPVYGKKEIVDAAVFEDIVKVEFEGEKFPAPIGYDIYLRSLYGNYEMDPPIEKQRTHHAFKAYRV